MKPASLPFRRVLSGTITAPTPRAPSAQTTYSVRLGAQSATRSPGVIPALMKAALAASAWHSSSRKLSCCAPSMIAGAAPQGGRRAYFENSKPHRTMRPMLKPTAEIRLPGAVVLVTGGARGIGAGIARAFLQAGAEVVVCGRTTPSLLPEAHGRSASFSTCDVRDAEALARLYAEITARHGRL